MVKITLGDIMITAVHIKNFKGIRDATLPLGQFTLLIGANGSGKSTAMEALQIASIMVHGGYSFTADSVNMDAQADGAAEFRISVDMLAPDGTPVMYFISG